MTDSYLAIVSANGLEQITLETEHARHFLLRRCFGRRRGCESCYWAYLEAENAQLIQWLIACGQRLPALWLLNEAALDAGSISPYSEELLNDAITFFSI